MRLPDRVRRAAPLLKAGRHGVLAPARLHRADGEDGVLAEIFRRIEAPTSPYFVEFGAEMGSEGNCVFLAEVLGWHGAFLEAAAEKHRVLASKSGPNDRVRTHRALVTPGTVDDLVDTLEVPDEPDLVSIDIDGVDYWVWRALVRHRSRVVVIEYNSGLGAAEALTVPEDFAGWDGFDYFGASIRAVERLGKAKGYTLVHTDLSGSNAFFVRDEDAGAFPEPVLVRGPNFFLKAMTHLPDADERAYVRDPPV